MSRDDSPRLVYSPRAWLKAQYLLHAGPTEIGAFALTAEDKPLYVEDWAAWPTLAESETLPQAITQWRQGYERCVRPMPARLGIGPDDLKTSRSPGFDPWLFPDDPFLTDLMHDRR